MTQAQKTAKDKFKKAIAYRKKTGVSLKEAFAHIYGKKIGAVKKKAAPKKKAVKKVVRKAAPKKKAVKKVVRKVVKKIAPKKVVRKKLTKLDYDKRYQANKPGKRTSASGNTYYESRPNRSDRGKLLGIGNVSTQSLQAVKSAISRLNEYKTNLERVVNSIKMSKEYGFSKNYVLQLRNSKKRYMDLIKETKTHISQLKKHI